MSKFEWVSKKPLDDLATLYESNITLNKSATIYFESAYIVLLGLDKSNKLIAVKPVTKEQASLNYIPDEQRHNITIKSSYSRVCNKLFLSEVAELLKLDFTKKNSYKYKAHWNKNEGALIIDLNKEEV
ncbi:MAG: hypothetical protein RBR96_00295 [Candidatus Izemoplasmatales bacterium]|jgi:hypothetical protein|nr:hypothetical protein [Candidatus Izemoplasmatales bacterium]